MPEQVSHGAEDSPGDRVRGLMRRAGQAALGTVLARGGAAHPYVSLVLVALDHDASPLLLLSDLADHAGNLAADPRAALLFQCAEAGADPLAAPRASVLGDIRKVADEDTRNRLRTRFLARHPSARTYADFGDFHLYAMMIERAHLVAGFGQIHWLSGADVRLGHGLGAAWAEAEATMVEDMNRDHGAAVEAIAGRLLGRHTPPPPGGSWKLTGIDPEGMDLRAGDRVLRATFAHPAGDPEEARREVIRLAERARRGGA